MEFYQILAIVLPIGLTALVAICSLIAAVVRFVKKWRSAKSEAEKAEALDEMNMAMQSIIANVEASFAPAETTVGKGTFAMMKKSAAMNELRTKAAELGVDFDANAWSEKIDNTVELTKKVNTK